MSTTRNLKVCASVLMAIALTVTGPQTASALASEDVPATDTGVVDTELATEDSDTAPAEPVQDAEAPPSKPAPGSPPPAPTPTPTPESPDTGDVAPEDAPPVETDDPEAVEDAPQPALVEPSVQAQPAVTPSDGAQTMGMRAAPSVISDLTVTPQSTSNGDYVTTEVDNNVVMEKFQLPPPSETVSRFAPFVPSAKITNVPDDAVVYFRFYNEDPDVAGDGRAWTAVAVDTDDAGTYQLKYDGDGRDDSEHSAVGDFIIGGSHPDLAPGGTLRFEVAVTNDLGDPSTTKSRTGICFAFCSGGEVEEVNSMAIDANTNLSTQPGADITCGEAVAQDDAAKFPLGLTKFCLDVADGSTHEVALTYSTDLTPSQVTAKKHDPADDSYVTISGATITESGTIGTDHSLVLTYSITDNGPLDQDSTAGKIVDPVGLSVDGPTIDGTNPTTGGVISGTDFKAALDLSNATGAVSSVKYGIRTNAVNSAGGTYSGLELAGAWMDEDPAASGHYVASSGIDTTTDLARGRMVGGTYYLVESFEFVFRATDDDGTRTTTASSVTLKPAEFVSVSPTAGHTVADGSLELAATLDTEWSVNNVDYTVTKVGDSTPIDTDRMGSVPSSKDYEETIDVSAWDYGNYQVTFDIIVDGFGDPDVLASRTVEFVIDNPVAPAIIAVSPTKGSTVSLGAAENLVLTVEAADSNGDLRELEVDHDMTASLPEFSVYADAANPCGGPPSCDAFVANGVGVSFAPTAGEWTIDFGPDVSQKIVDNGGIVFYLRVKDAAGNPSGSFSPPTPANTYAYEVTRVADPVDPGDTTGPIEPVLVDSADPTAPAADGDVNAADTSDQVLPDTGGSIQPRTLLIGAGLLAWGLFLLLTRATPLTSRRA